MSAVDQTLVQIGLLVVAAIVGYWFSRREKKDDAQTTMALAISQMASRLDHLETDNKAHAEQGKTLATVERSVAEMRVEMREVRHHLDSKIESMCQDFKRLSDTLLRLATPAPSAREGIMSQLRMLVEQHANG